MGLPQPQRPCAHLARSSRVGEQSVESKESSQPCHPPSLVAAIVQQSQRSCFGALEVVIPEVLWRFSPLHLGIFLNFSPVRHLLAASARQSAICWLRIPASPPLSFWFCVCRQFRNCVGCVCPPVRHFVWLRLPASPPLFIFVCKVPRGSHRLSFLSVPIVLHPVVSRRLFSIVSSTGHQPIAVSRNIYDHLVFSSPCCIVCLYSSSRLRKGVSPFQLQTAARSVEKARAEARSKEEAKDFRRAPYTKLNDQHSGRPPPPRDHSFVPVGSSQPSVREKEAKREAVYVPEDEPRASCSEPIVSSRQVVAFPPRALNQPFVQLRDAFVKPRQVERVVKIIATEGATTAFSSILPVHQNQEPQQCSVKVSSRPAFL
ncbi:hypothetical protein DAPPUDRAFT_115341 [Daphnia pulex]|uniref:Uncharacterized protein n=1 Tax=Daphnia pulex TaxID=6669 RepID=E9HL18_DAPPU|nr:hypothetical protein DAPPUDRAFT_115341 [Daphnia pulex]|eukprot:EFX67567.1 hypothetical protein DAPPUDRAFT_115341 [Daphnia pulex]